MAHYISSDLIIVQMEKYCFIVYTLYPTITAKNAVEKPVDHYHRDSYVVNACCSSQTPVPNKNYSHNTNSIMGIVFALKLLKCMQLDGRFRG